MLPKVVITGASGFIGHHFMGSSGSWHYIPVSLQNNPVEELELEGVTAVVHLAGIAHRMHLPSGELYDQVNHLQTTSLARCAKKAGVPFFIFLSTIKVYGIENTASRPIGMDTPCQPREDYGRSKWAAEEALRELEDDQFKVAIVRLPLVYGPGVKGNIARLIRWIEKSRFLPLGGIHNRRSMVYVGNVVALLHHLLKKPSSGTFLLSDPGTPVSTTNFAFALAHSMGRKVTMIPLPFTFLLFWVYPKFAQRLFGSLEIDSTSSLESLHFHPPYSFEQGISEMSKANSDIHHTVLPFNPVP